MGGAGTDHGPWSGWTAQDNADALLGAVADYYENDACCGFTVEARGVCDTLRAERDEALQQRGSARTWAVALERRLEFIRRIALRYQYHGEYGPLAQSLLAALSAPLDAPEQVQG